MPRARDGSRMTKEKTLWIFGPIMIRSDGVPLSPLERLHTLICGDCGTKTTFDLRADLGGNILKCSKCGKKLAEQREVIE